jgi:hypothetical protein
MDPNKLDLLRHVQYKLNPVCGRCQHSTFPTDSWGTCAAHQYNHERHDGMHDMSIHYSGFCSVFELDEQKCHDLVAFRPFLTGV